LKITSLTPKSFAIFNVSWAPLTNWLVTSFPDLVKTFSPFFSVCSLGAEKPPSCSGQTGIKTSFLERAITFSLGLLLPSYLHLIPNRQALQSFI